MQILYLMTQNFRNLEDDTIAFAPGVNVLYGPNAQGKTNILEAINVCATGSSFRGANDGQMTREEKDGYVVKVIYEENEIKREWSTEYQKDKPRLNRLGNKRVPAHHPERLKISVFTPEDLYLIKGPPLLRRRFLDFMLCQVYPEYENNLRRYNEALKKRTLLLRGEKINPGLNQVLEEILSESGSQLTYHRLAWVKKLEQLSSPIYEKLSGEKVDLKLRYVLSCPAPEGTVDNQVLTRNYLNAYEKARDREMKMHNNLVGPHREDVNFYLGKQMARVYASQGEQRNLAIALKIAELECYHAIKQSYPVFLLDEVFSELDASRRQYLTAVLSSARYQVIMTTVEYDSELLQSSNVLSVQKGRVRRKEA